ncbi:MAG: hypothetical protein GY757_26545 [bacterium]|nr:hypothetical protein [bacterium]
MKTRRFEKKLALNKETVVNLELNQMKNVNGGAFRFLFTLLMTECKECMFTVMKTDCDEC